MDMSSDIEFQKINKQRWTNGTAKKGIEEKIKERLNQDLHKRENHKKQNCVNP